MTRIGYTLMCEQSGPRELVRDAVHAERIGFDFEVMSDHYFPWLDSQGHAPNAWPTLGAVAQATERVGLMTYVTCPTMRYHPAIIAQQAATVGLLSDGRFTLGLGAGESLNEHVVGRGWPPANVRHEMFDEALEIISSLFSGEYVNFAGKHFRVDSAKL
jgi:G6PDH family F420-dependent oxidoreductase